MRATVLGILALGLLLTSSAFVLTVPAGRASPVSPSPAASYGITLYGSATSGWGLSPNTITQPGPSLTVFVGDVVTLHLYSNDSVPHSWYIDLNRDKVNDTGDISSATFSSRTVPHNFTFTVPNSPGTYSYYCNYHPTIMYGQITIAAAPTFVLYGSAAAGWGNTNTNLHNPGPLLSAHQGDVITLELISADGQAHTFFIDIDHSGAAPDSSDPQSTTFGGSNPPVTSFTYTVAAAPGNYTYYCGIHGTLMEGTFQVLSTTAPPAPSPPDYTLYAAIVVIVVIVAIIAVLAIRRKPRTPPSPPPQP